MYSVYSKGKTTFCMFICLLVSILSVSPRVHADLASAKDAYDMEEYADALQELLPLAESGNTEAQIIVGHMYNNGNGVTANLAKGAVYYQHAATLGNARAQALLAFLYISGRGVKRDHEQAAHWYLQAANQGDAYAQLDLARLYTEGLSVTKDYVQAYKWYVIVSENSDICDCLLDGKDILAVKMTGKEIKQAEKLAREWRSH